MGDVQQSHSTRDCRMIQPLLTPVLGVTSELGRILQSRICIFLAPSPLIENSRILQLEPPSFIVCTVLFKILE